MGMTNQDRTNWLYLAKEKSDKQKEQMEREKRQGKAKSPRVPRR